MKKLFLCFVLVVGCNTKTVTEFVEVPNLELENISFNEWDVRGTRNSASQRWNGQSGIHIVYVVKNNNNVPVNIKGVGGFFVARFGNDINTLHPYGDIQGDESGAVLTETVNFTNLEPGNELEILSAGGVGYLSSFVPVNWDYHYSVWGYMRFSIGDDVIEKIVPRKIRAR